MAKYVTDPKIAALLRDKDKSKKGEQGGIGTPATRHTFIVKLVERGYIQEKRKTLISTELGRSFHDALPPFATQPDLTALWHAQQKDIETGDKETLDFIHELVSTMDTHIQQVKAGSFNIQAEGHPCPACKEGVLVRRKGKYGFFWPCQNTECKTYYPDKRGKPDLTPKKQTVHSEHACQACGKPLIRRKSKPKKGKKTTTYWYGCSGFPSCKQTYFENNGKPEYEKANG